MRQNTPTHAHPHHACNTRHPAFLFVRVPRLYFTVISYFIKNKNHLTRLFIHKRSILKRFSSTQEQKQKDIFPHQAPTVPLCPIKYEHFEYLYEHINVLYIFGQSGIPGGRPSCIENRKASKRQKQRDQVTARSLFCYLCLLYTSPSPRD